MSTLSQIVGYLVIGAAMCGAIALFIVMACHWINKLIDARYDDAKREAQREIASRLISDSWWFTEDPTTSHLLKKIAEDLITHGWSDVSQVRDQWRRERESASVNQNQRTKDS